MLWGHKAPGDTTRRHDHEQPPQTTFFPGSRNDDSSLQSIADHINARLTFCLNGILPFRLVDGWMTSILSFNTHWNGTRSFRESAVSYLEVTPAF
ncbi:hypothetical protein CC2G_011050 [Coprinopsis cinerea AmutBmut pab1-1]|nr:hypothetical protein CC2G_011050 [Coprinopsis cinerea AmutBmut pab1-1]